MKRIFRISIFIILIGGLLWLAVYEKRDRGVEETVKEEKTVRQAAVSGQFYPDNKDGLIQMMDQFLNEVESDEEIDNIKALIVPHAGYVYSGKVAAYGFKVIEDSNFNKVILIGSSHNFHLSKATIDGNDAWQTPLGEVDLDIELRDKLIENDLFEINSEAHKPEHSLEVEVPFLQRTLNDFKLLPILVSSSINDSDLKKISNILETHIDERTLIVVSTDMSHYPEYNDASKIDKNVIDSILTGKVSEVKETIKNQSANNLDTCLCGQAAVEVLMNMVGERAEIELLKYANSGDVEVGNKERVVGYGSFSFSWSDEIFFNEEQKENLLSIAKQSVEGYLKTKSIPSFEITDGLLNRKLGAFVTLNKDHQLRGCIGRFEPNIPLYQVVSQMAVFAAFNDTRFNPVTEGELDELEYEISVLSPLRKIDSWQEIELGKHGVQIQKGVRSGVFLPQVAAENNWNLNRFMGELCSQKAGLDWDCWKNDDVDMYVFTATVFGED